MRFIAITSPSHVEGEAFLIERLFACGLDTLHLRKPDASIDDCRRLLDSLPQALLPRIVTHDHFSLCLEYDLGGVHLNRRSPAAPAGMERGSVSASCHSLAEVVRRKPHLDYVTLSPVFDSVSKQGYCAAFSSDALDQAASDGTIDSRVVALGGVTLATIPALRRWPFGGAALLGDLWQRAGTADFEVHARLVRKALDAPRD